MEEGLVKKIIISVVALGAMGASIFWALNKIGGNKPVVTAPLPIKRAENFSKEKSIFDDPRFQALRDNSVEMPPVEKIKTGNKNPFKRSAKE